MPIKNTLKNPDLWCVQETFVKKKKDQIHETFWRGFGSVY